MAEAAMDHDPKSNILSMTTFNNIVDFINNYDGLPIDCELDLKLNFPHIDPYTLKSILSAECSQRMKSVHHSFSKNSKELLSNFEKASRENPKNHFILLATAKNYCVSPTFLSRLVIHEKYKHLSKAEITEMVKNPHLIKDSCLAGNAINCIFSDNQQGPILDFFRRCLGEEYETKCKQMAAEIGLFYIDEENLRRTGFDKTPDLKLAIPCIYKDGFIVNWIESKALFGDVRTHKRYLQHQLISYMNRFGSGIVIYWFGFVEDVLQMKENGNGLMILNKFPETNNLEFLKI